MIDPAMVWVALPLLGLAVLLATVRLALGPTLADRIASLDLLIIMGAGIIAISAIYYNEASLLDVVAILALINFMSTVAFGRYLRNRIR